jgi:hypothetical protein
MWIMSGATRDMVDAYADILFVCDPEPNRSVYPSTTNEIPACRFVCVASCSVVRELLENVEIPLDPVTHRRTVRLNGASYITIQGALDIIHGTRCINNLCFEDILACRRGMEFLGCTQYDQEMADQLYITSRSHAIPENFNNIAAPILLDYPNLRSSTINELMCRMPFWAEMCAYLKEHVHITRQLAKSLIPYLVKFYPSSLVFEALVDNMQPASISQECVLELLGVVEIGIYFHPVEIVDTLRVLAKAFEANAWDSYVLSALRTLHLAATDFDVAPDAARCVHGSVVMFTTFPQCSVVLTVADTITKIFKMRVTPWLNITIDPRTGIFGASINLRKIDTMARVAPHLQLRLMALSRGAIGEVWYDWVEIPPARFFPLESCDIVVGSHEKLRDTLTSSSLRCIRLDFFYGDMNALENPLNPMR